MSHSTVSEVRLKSFESVESCNNEDCIIMLKIYIEKTHISWEAISHLQNEIEMEPGAENEHHL